LRSRVSGLAKKVKNFGPNPAPEEIAPSIFHRIKLKRLCGEVGTLKFHRSRASSSLNRFEGADRIISRYTQREGQSAAKSMGKPDSAGRDSIRRKQHK
jgi:hypothetical protein